MSRVDDNWQDYFTGTDSYASFSSLAHRVNETSYPGRCGKVKRGKTHPTPPREISDTIRLYEIASFYRAASSCMSETDRQKCLDVINGRLTSAYVEVGNQLFYLRA